MAVAYIWLLVTQILKSLPPLTTVQKVILDCTDGSECLLILEKILGVEESLSTEEPDVISVFCDCFHSTDTFCLSFYHKALLILQWFLFLIVVWLLVSFAISLFQQRNILTDMALHSTTSWSFDLPEN